ncbi:MAG: sulfatase-like hydrolase/transferase, partial [Armatimonadetes bacterium]|nr:sulfatase-like hydrolase/transferase [Armatimonadota bacterium]
MPDRKASRKVRLIIIGAIVVGLAGAVVWSKRWAKPVMEVRITVSAEGQEPVEVYRNRALVVGAAEDQRLLESEIDLGQWEGQLVRLDVTGTVRASAPLPLRRGHVACSAELVAPDGAQPLEFVGWENDGSAWLHFGRIGCPSLAAPGGGNPPFVFSESGSLWHVLRVPARAALRVALKPVLAEEAEEAKPFAGVVRSQLSRGRESSGTGAQRRHDVFVFLVDTLRADHLSCYGYSRATSPTIDAFAAEATLYEQANSAATWTRPSAATLLTGLYPFVHGAVHMKGDKLGEWPVLLPEILHDRGYAAYAVTANLPVDKRFGFNQGYDGFIYKYKASADWVNARVAEYLAP